ncbi:hypothetical protein ACFY1P_30105 [Streptomyces sp. NPDC001407]|uniref:hypothetical protein n=1 Tax=unclassified Streptomyces TaxID=2593676 RepID=UPI00367750AE
MLDLGMCQEPSRVIDVTLRVDHAPGLRAGEPEAARLAETDALCGYLGRWARRAPRSAVVRRGGWAVPVR